MTTYEATLVHAERGGKGTYRFEAKDGLIGKSAFKVVRKFMEHLEGRFDHDHFEWRVNASFKNKEKGIVTALGEFEFHGDDEQPFVCYIREV